MREQLDPATRAARGMVVDPGSLPAMRDFHFRLRDGSTRHYRVARLAYAFSLLEEEAWPDGYRHGPFPEGLLIAAISVDGSEWREIRPEVSHG